MVCVALVIRLTLYVWVVKQSNCADLVCHCNYWLAVDLPNVHYCVVLVVLVPQTFHSLVSPQTIAQPLQLEINRFTFDWPVCLDFVQNDFASRRFDLHVGVVCAKVKEINDSRETKDLFKPSKSIAIRCE
jgi:hypothetical protein